MTVVDPLLGTLSCTPTQPATLAPGASIVCTGSYTLLQADINAGERANTATADSDQTAPTETPNGRPGAAGSQAWRSSRRRPDDLQRR